MSAKLIAAALVIAGGLGAAAGYLQNNPGTLAALGPRLLAFGGPLAPSSAADSSYVPGKYYRLCRNEYASNLRSMSQTERREACRCFDRAFRTWSPEMRDAATLAMQGAIVLSKAPRSQDIADRYRDSDPRKLSRHEKQVMESQMRDSIGSLRRSYDRGLNRTSVEKARANPVTTVIATGRLAALARRCGIIDSGFAIPNMR